VKERREAELAAAKAATREIEKQVAAVTPKP
jgi:hypothetical protein